MPPIEKYSAPPEIFDPSVLHGYVGDDIAAGKAILGQFIDATQTDFGNVAAAITLGHAPDVYQLSHRMKSASKMLGCATLAAAAGKLEEAGKDANWRDIPRLIKELESALADTFAAIRKQLAAHEEQPPDQH